MVDSLLSKINSRDAKVGIVGLGYVGLPLALSFSEAGFCVTGIDSDHSKVEQLCLGRSYFSHVESARVDNAIKKGLSLTTQLSGAQHVDVIILCLPTPLGKHREPDLSYVTTTLDSLLKYVAPGQAICLESTTYPGTTTEEIVPRVEKIGLNVGEDVNVIYSPEREDPGNEEFSTRSIPKVVAGHTPACLKIGLALYAAVIEEVVPVSSTETAEMTKLLENIHRAVNIGLVNELKILCDKMGIDIFEVVRAAATKPFGFTPFFPGPGLGGHCIPIDPFYLTWKAKEFGVATRFIELAGEINTGMPAWVVNKVVSALNKNGTAIKGSDILLIGIAYKKGTSDLRESPGLEIMSRLKQMNANVRYHDPLVAEITKQRQHDLTGRSVPITEREIQRQDCLVICTDQIGVDYDLILRNSALIVDTRGIWGSGPQNVIHA